MNQLKQGILLPGLKDPVSIYSINHEIEAPSLEWETCGRMDFPPHHSFSIKIGESFDKELEEVADPELRLRIESNLPLAIIEVMEFPGLYKAQTGIPWDEWLDMETGDHEPLGKRMRQLEKIGMDPMFGSLFYIDAIHVHPAIRGQGVGVHMLRRILWGLARNEDDLFMLFAQPLRSIFDRRDEEVDRSVKAVNRLARYYEKAGLKKVRKTSNGILMEARVEL